MCQENCKVTEDAEYCKEFVMGIARYLIEQSTVRSLLG